jgi:AsmA protein
MRRIVVILGIIIVAVAVAALVFVATFDVNRYREPIQTQLENRLGRAFTLGPMRLGLFPPSFRVDDLVIADDPAFENPRPFVEAGRVNVSVKLLPLLRGIVEVTSLDLRHPTVELIKSEEGVWNFSTLGPREEVAPDRLPEPKPLAFANLSIDTGQLAVTDREAGRSRVVYRDVQATLRDFAPDRSFSVHVAGQLPGEGPERIQVEGTGGPLGEGDLAAIPFQGTVTFDRVSLGGLQRYLDSPALAEAQGTVSGTTRLDVEEGVRSLEGEMEIRDIKVRNVALGYPVNLSYSVSENLDTGLLTIADAIITFGATPVSVSGDVDTRSTSARLNLRITTDNASLEDLYPLMDRAGISFSPATTLQGRLSADIQVRGTTDDPALNGAFSATSVQVRGEHLAVPLAINSVRFQLTPTEIRSHSFEVVSGETRVRSSVAIQGYNAPTPSVSATLQATDAELRAVLALARAYGVTALDNVAGEGTLSLDMRLSGPVESLRGDAVLRALGGESEVSFTNLRLIGTNLSRDISRVAGFLRVAGDGPAHVTDITRMTGRISIERGIARTDSLVAELDLGVAAVRGTADLADQTLNLRINAVVSEGVSRQVGGTAVGGYLRTALANEQGELVVPILVTGTFEQPRVSPDAQSVAEMRLRGLLPTSSDPARAVAGILGDLLGSRDRNRPQPDGEEPQQESPAERAVERILDLLSDRKEQDREQETED